MEIVTLNNGVEMPILGFGVYQIPPDDTERAVADALENHATTRPRALILATSRARKSSRRPHDTATGKLATGLPGLKDVPGRRSDGKWHQHLRSAWRP
jgi:hypothetical protein